MLCSPFLEYLFNAYAKNTLTAVEK